MTAIRRWGMGLLAVAAIAVYFGLAPDEPDEGSTSLTPTNYQTLVSGAMSDYDVNNANTDSAPQQQVVNGWVAKDLLQIQALELADMLNAISQENEQGQLVAATDDRIPALLVVAVLAITLIGITTEPGAPIEVVQIEDPVVSS